MTLTRAPGRRRWALGRPLSPAVLAVAVLMSLLELSGCAQPAPAPPVDRALSQQIDSFRTSLIALSAQTATTQELAARIDRGDLVFATAMPTTIDKSYLPTESDFVGRYGSKVKGDAVEIMTLVFASARAATSSAYVCVKWTVGPKAKTVSNKQVSCRADIHDAVMAVKAREESLSEVPN